MGFLQVSSHICQPHLLSQVPQDASSSTVHLGTWAQFFVPMCFHQTLLLKFILQTHPFSSQVLPCVSYVWDQHTAHVQFYTFCLLNRIKSSELHCFLWLMNSLRGVKITSVINPNCEGLMSLFFCSPPLLLDSISPHLIQSADLIQPCLAQLVWIHYIDNINLCNSCIRIFC